MSGVPIIKIGPMFFVTCDSFYNCHIPQDRYILNLHHGFMKYTAPAKSYPRSFTVFRYLTINSLATRWIDQHMTIDTSLIRSQHVIPVAM